MAGRIPTEFINEVRNNTNIVDVISQYVQLQKKGKNLFGLCPFHEEKTGSFSVSEDKQIFHCFSCGRGGNVFQFLVDLENISFPEAVIEVAKMQNISLPSGVTGSTEDNFASEGHTSLRKMHQDVTDLYHHILVATKTGEDALAYLINRGIKQETIDQFKLGFAPDSSNLVTDFLRNKGYSDDDLRESGILVDANDRLFDRFKGRVMYPILDQSGNTIAFSGRKMTSGGDEPKYLNSPETPIFNKSKLLFNFDIAKREVRQTKKLYLFEGYMDVISAFQAGVKTGIASMGTSLTDEQIYMMRRVTNELIVCYDGDQPGIKATSRAIGLLQSQTSLNIGVVSLPNGQDPDEYIRNNGPEKFQNALAAAITPIEFGLNVLQTQYNLENDREKLEYTTRAIQLIAKENSPIAIDLYLGKLAQLLSVSIDSLKTVLLTEQRKVRRTVRSQTQQSQNVPLPDAPPEDDEASFVPPAIPKNLSIEQKAEQRLLFLTLHDVTVNDQLISTQFHFLTKPFEEIFEKWQEFIQNEENPQISEFIDYISNQLKGIIVEMEMMDLPTESVDEEVQDCINVIEKGKRKRELALLQQDMVDAKKINDQEEVLKLTQRIIALRRLIG